MLLACLRSMEGHLLVDLWWTNITRQQQYVCILQSTRQGYTTTYPQIKQHYSKRTPDIRCYRHYTTNWLFPIPIPIVSHFIRASKCLLCAQRAGSIPTGGPFLLNSTSTHLSTHTPKCRPSQIYLLSQIDTGHHKTGTGTGTDKYVVFVCELPINLCTFEKWLRLP